MNRGAGVKPQLKFKGSKHDFASPIKHDFTTKTHHFTNPCSLKFFRFVNFQILYTKI